MGTSPNRSVVIGLTDCVALFAAGRGRRMPFRQHERVRRTLRATRLELFAEGNLLRTQALFTVDGGPTWRSVAAAKEFLVDGFVAGAAIARSQMGADRKAVVIDFLLAGARLVAVEAIDALLRVGGHLVFMDDRVLKPCVTFGAFSRRPNEVRRRLSRFHTRTLPVDQEPG